MFNISHLDTTSNHYHDSGSSYLISLLGSLANESSLIKMIRKSRLQQDIQSQGRCKNRLSNNNDDDDDLRASSTISFKLFNNNYNYNKNAFALELSSISLTRIAFIITNLILILMICHYSFGSNNQVQSLNCYHCSSMDNPGCDESFSGRANFTDTDCEKHIGRPAKVCRKLVQHLENKKVIIRSCGYIDDHEKEKKSICYKRSGTFAIMMESCNCYTDNCNHSASLVPNKNVLILSSFSLLLVLVFYSAFQFKCNNNNAFTI